MRIPPGCPVGCHSYRSALLKHCGFGFLPHRFQCSALYAETVLSSDAWVRREYITVVGARGNHLPSASRPQHSELRMRAVLVSMHLLTFCSAKDIGRHRSDYE